MSRRNRRQDETWMKESVTAALNTGDQNDRLSTGGCRRRSLFSTERLDLILSNLRRNLVSGSDQCKQISHDVSYSGDAEPPQQQQQQQQQHGAEYRHSKQKTLTPRRHALSEKTSTGGDDMLDDEPNNPPAAAENAAQSSYCHVNNNDRLDSSRDAHHNDVIADSDDGAKLRDQSDRCPIKKSVSFRAEWQPPGGNTDADKRIMSSTYRSLPRPRQRTDQRQQHNQHSAPVPFSKTTDSGRDWLSVKSGLRDLNNKQDSGSRRSQSSGPSRRSTCASGLMTQQDCGAVEVLNSSGSGSSTDRSLDDCSPCPRSDHHRRHPSSINWFVDLTDVPSTEVRQPTSPGTSSLRRYQGDCRTAGAGSNGDPIAKKLEPEPFSGRTRREASNGRGRAATRSTLDQLRVRHQTMDTAASTSTARTPTAASTSTSAPAEPGGKSTHPRRTWSPKANRTSELRTNKNAVSEDRAFHRSSVSQFRRSMTKPKYPETLVHAGCAVKPAERDVSTRTRSVSLSEQYRMLIASDWFDNFAASAAFANQHKQTPPVDVQVQPKPLALTRRLKPDFVIYV